MIFTFIGHKAGFGRKYRRCLICNVIRELLICERLTVFYGNTLSITIPFTTDNSIHVSLSEDTKLGQNCPLIGEDPGQGTVLELQGLRKEGAGRGRNHRGHLGVGRMPGEAAWPGASGDLQPAWPGPCSPWSPYWGDWINHISHALIGADNWRVGFVERKCVQINLAEWNRKNGTTWFHLVPRRETQSGSVSYAAWPGQGEVGRPLCILQVSESSCSRWCSEALGLG